ncbi:MAG: thioredoxin family protein [archaeon]
MKIENPLLFGIVGLLIIGGIFLLLNGKADPVSSAEPILEETMNEKQGKYSLAPELDGIAGYINTPAGTTLADFKGKVVIVDFWTYSCINCIRTQPYLNAWYDQYADKGLVIVGVHTPEFEFEKKYENVQKAVEDEKINYPVVLDNDFQTWRAYKNQYWPRKYLIDADGFIRFDHIGEGAYEETEMEIQQLLKERDEKIQLASTVSGKVGDQLPDNDFSQVKTPEIYLGYQFARAPLANPESFQVEQTVSYALPESIPANLVALEGSWTNHSDYMELASDEGMVVLNYTAKNVNIVASNAAEINVELNDAFVQTISVSDEKLYSVVNDSDYASKKLTLNVSGKGFRLYTFTFG